MDLKDSKTQHIPALDGFRGLAAILVVVFHIFEFLSKYLFFGWIGLEMFFVLSGYLITDILIKTVGRKNYLRNFYMRRILRIFPLYYLCLLIFLVIFPLLDIELGLKYYTDNQVWLWTYMQNWLYIFKNPSSNTLNHLWSMAVEEHFYILWPLVILLLRKPKYLLIFLFTLFALVVGLRIWVWSKHIQDFAYFNLFAFTRIDGICVGCILAISLSINKFFIKKYLLAIVMILIALNVLFIFINREFDYSLPYLGYAGYASLAVIFGLLAYFIILQESRLLNSFFNFRLFRFFGRISYGFYMFHWPIYLLLSPYLFSLLSSITNSWTTNFITSLITTLAGITVGWLSYKYFESFFLKMKKRYSPTI